MQTDTNTNATSRRCVCMMFLRNKDLKLICNMISYYSELKRKFYSLIEFNFASDVGVFQVTLYFDFSRQHFI